MHTVCRFAVLLGSSFKLQRNVNKFKKIIFDYGLPNVMLFADKLMYFVQPSLDAKCTEFTIIRSG